MTENKSNTKYHFANYKPNKNCKKVEYKGVTYLSKAQCCALEFISMKELNKYLSNK